jgi:hypothetical protein
MTKPANAPVSSYAQVRTVYLLPGENLGSARKRWEGATGRRGLILVR